MLVECWEMLTLMWLSFGGKPKNWSIFWSLAMKEQCFFSLRRMRMAMSYMSKKARRIAEAESSKIMEDLYVG